MKNQKSKNDEVQNQNLVQSFNLFKMYLWWKFSSEGFSFVPVPMYHTYSFRYAANAAMYLCEAKIYIQIWRTLFEATEWTDDWTHRKKKKKKKNTATYFQNFQLSSWTNISHSLSASFTFLYISVEICLSCTVTMPRIYIHRKFLYMDDACHLLIFATDLWKWIDS